MKSQLFCLALLCLMAFVVAEVEVEEATESSDAPVDHLDDVEKRAIMVRAPFC
jgi:hypothetical protein